MSSDKIVKSKHHMIIVQNQFDDEKKENPYAFEIIKFHQDQKKEAELIDEHNLPTDWNKGNFFEVDPKVIFQIRLLIFFFVFCNSVYQFIFKPYDYIFMESLWCYNFAVLTLFCQLIASKSKWLHGFALHCTEITISLSIGITIAYWPFQFQNFMRDYTDQRIKENYEYANAFVVHTFPFYSCFFELLFFKVVFLKKDAKIPALVLFGYLPFNYYGKYFTGQAVYWQSDLADWSHPYNNLGLTLALIFVAYLTTYICACITQFFHGYVENSSLSAEQREKREQKKLELETLLKEKSQFDWEVDYREHIWDLEKKYKIEETDKDGRKTVEPDK